MRGWQALRRGLAAALVRRDELQAYYGARAQEYERIYSKPERQGDLGSHPTVCRTGC